MTNSEQAQTRILVGASSFADAAAALNILRLLKSDTSYTFGGLFVEETATIALCQIPNQRIVSGGGTLVVAPSAAQLRTVMDADARAFRTSLEQISRSIAGHCKFERSLGDLVQVALQVSQGWDIIVFGHRSVHPVGGKIVVLEGFGAHDQALADFADHLAKNTTAERLVLSVGADPAAPRNDRHFDTVHDALRVLARMNVEGVLVDLAHGPIHTIDDLRCLLDLARCPVFAFGAAYSGDEFIHGAHIPSAPERGE